MDDSVSNRLAASVDNRDWRRVTDNLDAQGWAILAGLLTEGDCRTVADYYSDPGRFRKRVDMARHGYGQGEYKYFTYPLPTAIVALRTAFYPHLARVANNWHERLRFESRFPDDHATYLEQCHAAGQTLATPLLLQYEQDGYNCLHQDLYGEHVFPLQVAVLLSQPGEDFVGGEFVLTEQRPRMQSRPSIAQLARGDAVIFAVRFRPIQGARGFRRAILRHGVSTVHSGHRTTLGIIFHDAA